MMRRLAKSVQPVLIATFVATQFAAVEPARAQAAEVVDIAVRGDARQRVLLLAPPGAPKAVVLLYSGGSGNIKLQADGTIRNRGNFLIRNRDLFVKQGFLTVLVDRPSDWAGSDGDRYRVTEAHAEDTRAILDLVRKRTAAPVWLIGTSRGSISAAHIARLLGRKNLAGIVMSASVTRPGGRRTQTVHDIDLSDITVPVLVLGHEDDDCDASPWSDQKDLLDDLTGSPRKAAIGLEGGDHGDPGAPCASQSHHGFLGLESDAVATIAGWITANSR
ncbi:MAG: alpha/beta hydrolase [Pseudomonadota bacterium]